MTNVITPAVDTSHPNDSDPAYIESMVAKAEGREPVIADAPLLAGKYKTPEDLDKGILELLKKKSGGDLQEYYKGLEKEFHGIAQEVAPVVTPAGTPEEAPTTPPADEQEGTPKVGLDYDKYSIELAQGGVLTEASYAEIEAVGIPRPMIDQYVSGLLAVQNLNKAHAYNLVGGEEVYKEMIQWAGVGLTVEQREEFNKGIATNDLDKRGAVIASLFKQFNESNPVLLDSDGGYSETDVYKSRVEMSVDMNDPRYKKDPAFRDMVMQKLGRSKIM